MNVALRTLLMSAVVVVSANALALDKTIADSYAKIQAATLKKDVAALKQIWQTYVDPSCVADHNGKKTTYKQLTAQIEPQLRAIKKVNVCKVQILNSKTKSGKTLCLVETTEQVVIPVGGKDSIFDIVSTVEDTWQKISGKYKIVGIRTIKETIKQDGKVIQAG